MVKITEIEKSSRAAKAGIKAADELISINGNEINDVLDYRFYLTERSVTLALKRDGVEYSVKIKKGEYDDIGLGFETPLMDKKHTCKNGCIFCFIDQNPEGMRESIYFKDDDSRLSFIHGNYVTLTNMTDGEVARIIKMRISPINVSIHTTNPELRVRMMKNKRSGDVLRYLDDFKNAGLKICGQIVLCRGVNDGSELERTLSDLAEYYPALTSIAVVPAGLTKHREGLYPLSDFTKDEAASVINMIEAKAALCKEKYGTSLIYASDEFYLKAEKELPDGDYYEDYPQIENGVGLLRSLTDEFDFALEDVYEALKKRKPEPRKVTIATGKAAYPTLLRLADALEKIVSGLSVNVRMIKNYFFGESITVAGLLTGKDIYEQLKDSELGDELLISSSCLREEENDFLCGMTVDELSSRLGVPVCAVDSDGYAFIEAVLGFEI